VTKGPLPRKSDFELASVLWHYHHVDSGPRECDLIVGLGSYDLRVADYCAELFDRGVADHLLFSGASGNWTRDRWKAAEAEVFAKRAMAAGVPREAILLEPRATHIGENLSFSRERLRAEKVSIERVTLVTKPNTLRRVKACLPLHWPEPQVFLTAPPLSLSDQVTPERSLREMIHELVGDLQRILCYPEKGYAVAQPLPDVVKAAYLELMDRGFVDHLVADLPVLPREEKGDDAKSP